MGHELSYFGEPDIRRLFPEALTADVQAVLANKTGGVGADTAVPSSCQHLFPHTSSVVRHSKALARRAREGTQELSVCRRRWRENMKSIVPRACPFPISARS